MPYLKGELVAIPAAIYNACLLQSNQQMTTQQHMQQVLVEGSFQIHEGMYHYVYNLVSVS